MKTSERIYELEKQLEAAVAQTWYLGSKAEDFEEQLKAVTKQRDALAEALQRIEKDDVLGWAGDLAGKALAAVKG